VKARAGRGKPEHAAEWGRFLARDHFGRIRSDAELGRLVLSTARRTRSPYSMLVAALLGAPGLEEEEARAFWARAVEHRRALAGALARPVHLRVAALDLALQEDPGPRPLVVERSLVQALVEEATHDALTRLPNRRHLSTVLEHELRQRRRPSLAVLDVDGFKAVNDAHGHARGDAVLRSLATILRKSCRKGDAVARIGGDEFAVLFVGAGEAAARSILGRVRAAFVKAHGDLGVDVSFGLAEAQEGSAPGSLFRTADLRMYEAKKRVIRGNRAATPPAVGIYATHEPGRFRELHALAAGRGVMLIPARTAETARRLDALVAPRLVFADLLMPPRGGQALLAGLEGGPGSAAKRVLVAPERWRAVGRGLAPEVTLLPFPPPELLLEAVLRGHTGKDAASLATLATDEEVLELMAEVDRMTRSGLAGPGEAAARPEIDLIRAMLGS